MKLIISNSSHVPIYEQIKQQIIEQIINDDLVSDEPLPSIRALAQDIKISVMTIKKAYDQLENEGYIIQTPGKGTFVAPKNPALAEEHAWQNIEGYLTKIIDIAKKHDITSQELKDLIDIFYRSEEK